MPDYFQILLLLTALVTTKGCHNIETEGGGEEDEIADSKEETDYSEEDDYFADEKIVRRKRSANHDDSIVEYFPGCIATKLSASSTYSNRKWQGPVSYAVYHSNWFEEVDTTTCTGRNHTMECWTDNLPFFITGVSPALLAAQECVKDYTDFTSGRANQRPRYKLGLFVMDSNACPDVDVAGYETDFIEALNGTVSELSLDNTISDFSDVVEFARNDMICLSCTCQDLDEDDDDNTYDFDDGTSCGDCWTTRLATSTRRSSKLRKPVKRATKKRTKLRKRPKPPQNRAKQNTKNSNSPRQEGNSNQGRSDAARSPNSLNRDQSQNNRERSGNRNENTFQPVFVPPVETSGASSRSGQADRQQSASRQPLRETNEVRPFFVQPVEEVGTGGNDQTRTTQGRQQENDQTNVIVQPISTEQQTANGVQLPNSNQRQSSSNGDQENTGSQRTKEQSSNRDVAKPQSGKQQNTQDRGDPPSGAEIKNRERDTSTQNRSQQGVNVASQRPQRQNGNPTQNTASRRQPTGGQPQRRPSSGNNMSRRRSG